MTILHWYNTKMQPTDTVIHLRCAIDEKTVPYASFMWKTARALASRPELLWISLHCMNARAIDLARHEFDHGATIHGVPKPDWIAGALGGSSGHAACMEHAFSMFDNSEITIISDADACIVARGWDELIRNVIEKKDIGLFGVTYEDIGGFSSG